MIKYFSRNLRSGELELRHLIPNLQNAQIIYDVLKHENPDDYKYEYLVSESKILPKSVADTLKMMRYHADTKDSCTFYMFYNNRFIGVRKISYFKEAFILKLNSVWLVRAARGYGFATESYRAIENIAFNKLKVNKIMRVNFVENKMSAKLAENTGFILDGISRQAVYMNGKFYDLMQWSKLHSDYLKETTKTTKGVSHARNNRFI